MFEKRLDERLKALRTDVDKQNRLDRKLKKQQLRYLRKKNLKTTQDTVDDLQNEDFGKHLLNTIRKKCR